MHSIHEITTNIECMAKPSLMAAQVGWIEMLVLSPIRYALASLGNSLIIVKFSRGIAVYYPRYEWPKKLILDGLNL